MPEVVYLVIVIWGGQSVALDHLEMHGTDKQTAWQVCENAADNLQKMDHAINGVTVYRCVPGGDING